MNVESNNVNVLKLSLHDSLVGYLIGFNNGKNIFKFADEFMHDSNRPTMSLVTHPDFPNANKVMSKPWVRNQRLHPIFSNLLPEGALRELLSQGLKVHINERITQNKT